MLGKMSIEYDKDNNTYDLFVDHEWIWEGTYEECRQMYSNYLNSEIEEYEEYSDYEDELYEEYEEYLGY